MKKSPVAALKEDDITSAAEEALQFGNDNLRGENKKWRKAHMSERPYTARAYPGFVPWSMARSTATLSPRDKVE